MKGFVFDLDNTLFDRYATIAKVIENGYDRVKKYINPAYDLERTVDHACRSEALYLYGGWKLIYERLIDEHFFNADNIPPYEKVQRFMVDGFMEVAVPHPFTNGVLKKLREGGYKLAIITNCAVSELQRRKIKLLGIEDMFDAVVITGELAEKMSGDVEDSRYHKPSPDVFLHTAELLGEKPGDLYYVGDNPKVDVMGAYNSGYTPVWIMSRSPWTLSNDLMPKYSFKTIEGVLDLI